MSWTGRIEENFSITVKNTKILSKKQLEAEEFVLAYTLRVLCT